MPYLAVLAALLWEWSGGAASFFGGRPARGSGFGHKKLAVTPLVAVIVLLFLAERALIVYAAHGDGTSSHSMGFWVEMIDDRGTPIDMRRSLQSLLLFLTVCAQAYTLYRLYQVTARIGCRRDVVPILVGVVAMFAVALLAPAVASGDVYAYIGDAFLGASAYHPPKTALPGQYSIVTAWWRPPLEATPYGPLWIKYNQLLLGLAPSIPAKIELARAAGAAWLAALILLLARRVSPPALTVLALNPALISQFVADAHNDIIPITLLAASLTFARKPAFQATLGAAAALVKLPFLLIGMAVLQGSRAVRLAAATGLLVLTGVGSLGLGGTQYLQALRQHVIDRPGSEAWPHVILVAVTLLLATAAVLCAARSKTGAFAFSSLAATLFPWYAAWGLPYAVAAEALPGFLIAMPIAAFLFASAFDTRLPLIAVTVLLCAATVRHVVTKRARIKSAMIAAR